jgi:N utilization substance protein B
VWQHLAALDAEIGAVSSGWRIERMPAVDRAILRLALYELRHTDTPLGVVIDEAVELAKRYSTERSGAFVNGVLAKLA